MIEFIQLEHKYMEQMITKYSQMRCNSFLNHLNCIYDYLQEQKQFASGLKFFKKKLSFLSESINLIIFSVNLFGTQC